MKKIVFAGDFYYDYDIVTEDIKEIGKWIRSNEYDMVLNLEGSFGEVNPIKKRGPNLHMHRVAVDAMKELNVKAVCMSNNHMMDFGSDGLESTLAVLDKEQIMHVGAGLDLKDALKPVIILANDKRIGILNFGWDIEETVYATEEAAGCAPKEKNIIKSSIKQIRGEVDYLIVCLHWGFEYNRLPLPCDVKLAHEIIDLGADLIIGNHPQCVQPIETYKEKKIYYSLGNFYFGRGRNEYNKTFKGEVIKNQSDYGILVGLDCNSFNVSEKMVYYNKQKNESYFVDCDRKVLEDISNVNYDSWSYYKKVFERRNNINPILTDRVLVNEIKIRFLFVFYNFKAFVKKIVRR